MLNESSLGGNRIRGGQFPKMVPEILVSVLVLVLGVSGHERFWGECPLLKPMDNFEWKQVSAKCL